MDARTFAGLLLRGARAPRSGVRHPGRAVSRGAKAALGVARALHRDDARRGGSVSLSGRTGARSDARGDRSTRRNRDAAAAGAGHTPNEVGELPWRAGTRFA